jgi:hypothetical protein
LTIFPKGIDKPYFGVYTSLNHQKVREGNMIAIEEALGRGTDPKSATLRALNVLDCESWRPKNLTGLDRKVHWLVISAYGVAMTYVVFWEPGLTVRLAVEMFLLGLGLFAVLMLTGRVLSIRRSMKNKEKEVSEA